MNTVAFLSWIVLGGIAFFSLLAVTVWLYKAGGILRRIIAPLVGFVAAEALCSTLGLLFVRPGSPVVSWMNGLGRLVEIIGVVVFVVAALRFREVKEAE